MFNVVFSRNSMRIGFGGIVGTSSGYILASLSGCHDFFSSNLGTEAIVIYEDLCLANKMGFQHIMVLSDSLAIIQMFQGTLNLLLKVAN